MKKFIFLFAIMALTAFSATAAEVIGAPHEWGYTFQEGHNALNDLIVGFHNDILLPIISVITLFVLGLIVLIIVRFRASKNPKPSDFTHNTKLEIIWTIVPIIIVAVIMVPSIRLLYKVDHVEKADLTLKVVGYQWYWGYELPDQGVAEFESRIIPSDKLKEGERKLLEVDEPVLLPVGKTVRVLLTGDPLGVIHAWGVPALSIKRDAMPGRTNEGWLKIEKPGIYYGECYELCGPDHAFMPIKVIGVSEEEFNAWVVSKGGKPLGSSAEVSEAVGKPAAQQIGDVKTAKKIKEKTK